MKLHYDRIEIILFDWKWNESFVWIPEKKLDKIVNCPQVEEISYNSTP